MKEQMICPQEPMVLAARVSAHWNDALSQHLASCVSCRSAADLAGQMQELSAVPTVNQPPDADVIWMMAQISKPRPKWTTGTTEGVSALSASALLAVWCWPAITGYVSNLVPAQAMAIVPMLASCIVAVGLAITAFATRHLLTDE